MDMPKISLMAARVNANLTQDQAAAAIGCCRSSLQNYEKGKTIPPWDKVRKMEEVYGIPVDYFNFIPKNTLKEKK